MAAHLRLVTGTPASGGEGNGAAFDLVEALGVEPTRRLVHRGDHLYHAGSPFTSLFVLHSGYLMTVLVSEDGREQVTGFAMRGDLLGFDGIVTNTYHCDAVALDDSEVFELPFARLERRCREDADVQHRLFKLMSAAIQAEEGLMLLLGSMNAEERLAAFLLKLSQRYAALGFSARRFVLRMRREEIGSYLGLKVETISRTFARLHERGLVRVSGKDVELLDPDGLHRLVQPPSR